MKFCRGTADFDTGAGHWPDALSASFVEEWRHPREFDALSASFVEEWPHPREFDALSASFVEEWLHPREFDAQTTLYVESKVSGGATRAPWSELIASAPQR